MASIVLDRITKRFPNGFCAVRDLSLEIEDGEFLVLVGPSGCGKTTALRMVAGLETVSSGDVYLGGTRVNDVLEKDRDMAMVFQNYALYPHMTVAQNIGFSLKLTGLPRHQVHQRVKEIAELLGLSDLLDRRPRQLSGGQRQRVAMGRAIVRRPQAFLMDEPLSNLDAKLRVQMRGEIASLQKRLATTTMYVTHDQVEALTMGDRVAVLKAGELQQVGTPRQIYDEPCNLFVAGFIGSPPMNIVHGRLERRDTGAVAVLGSVEVPMPPAVVEARRLGDVLDRDVIVGVRPEDVHQSLDAADPIRIDATVHRVEAVGAALLVYFTVDARAVRSESIAAAASGEHFEGVPLVSREGATLCATFEPRSFVRPDDKVAVTIDPARLHLFDAGTELALGS